MSDRAPDVLGEVVAYRAWKVIGTVQLPMLASVVHSGAVWHPQRWTIANCQGRDECPHSRNDAVGPGVPGERCTCGMYAARDREHLIQMGYNHYHDDASPVFIGEVGLAGKVIPGTQGWRAEKGRIRKLWVPFHLIEYVAPLERLYGVTVELTNTFDADPERLVKLLAQIEGR
jgi:hypothetical protein